MDVIEFRRLSPEAKLPTRAHPSDAGLDLYASEDVALEAGGQSGSNLSVSHFLLCNLRTG